MAKVRFKRIQDSTNIGDLNIEDGSFIVTGDGKTYIDYGTNRVPTSGTPDSTMSDSSRNTVENKVIKEYVDDNINDVKDNLQPVILYKNLAGTTGNVTLSDNINNYTYIELLYKRGEGQGGSCKINLSTTKKINLISTLYSNGSFYIDCKYMECNGTSINNLSNSVLYYSNGTMNIANANNISVCEVLGYK